MSDIVAVARDGRSAIIRVAGSSFATVSHATPVVELSNSLADARRGGSWRSATANDAKKFKSAIDLARAATSNLSVTAAGSDTPRRMYRIPKTVKREILRGIGWIDRKNASDSNSDVLSLARYIVKSTSVDIDTVQLLSELITSKKTNTLSLGYVPGQEGYPNNHRVTDSLLGGEAAMRWTQKTLRLHKTALTASAFIYDDDITYFGAGPNENSTEVDTLYALVDNSIWWKRAKQEWVSTSEPTEALLIELDEESVTSLAEWLDSSDGTEHYFELRNIDPIGRNLYDLAEPVVDWKYIDYVTQSLTAAAPGYSPQERSQNAQRQTRATDGKFGGGGVGPQSSTLSKALSKARLPMSLALIENVSSRIDEYLSAAQTEDTTEELASDSIEGKKPLYMALVDEVDRDAVLDIVAITADESGSGVAWKRSGGEWIPAPEIMSDLRGSTPPPVVELPDDETVKNVVTQVDQADGNAPEPDVDEEPVLVENEASLSADPTSSSRDKDAKRGYALKDGSFPIRDIEDLKKAIKAYGRATDSKKPEVRKHIKKRARALGRTDLIPESWASLDDIGLFGQYGEIIPLYGPRGEVRATSFVAAGIPGIADTPSDFAAAARLKRYWKYEAGGAKIRWNTPGDMTRCMRNLRKYMGPRAAGYCAILHKEMTGVWPGDRRNIGRRG